MTALRVLIADDEEMARGRLRRLLSELRAAFGDTLMIENDVDAAALAERAHGHGREFESFAFISIGTGIGMGLVLDGRLRRGRHGAAGAGRRACAARLGAADRRTFAVRQA